MPIAFYKVNKKLIKINEADSLNSLGSLCRDSLSCASRNEEEKCLAKITFTEGYPNRFGNLVSSYFRLGKNQKHAKWCRYNPEEVVKIIAADSDSDVFREIEKGHFEFRLNIITESLIEISKEKERIFDDGLNRPSQEVTVKKQGKLSSYFRTASQLAGLRNQMYDDERLRDLVILRNNREKIPWSSFFYELGDYRKCFNYLKNQSQKDWKDRHPVCISGRIKKIISPKFHNGKITRMVILKEDQGFKNSEGFSCIPSVLLFIHDDGVWQAINKAGEGSSIFAFDNYRISIRDAEKLKQTKNFGILGNINHRNQIFVSSDEPTLQV